MRIASVSLVLLIVTALPCIELQADPPATLARPNASQVTWHSNLQDAHKVATANNKPLLIVFGADWCHYCKKLEKETLSQPQLEKYIGEAFVPVHLDADKDQRVAKILGIRGLPCSVVVSPKADLLGRIDGYHTANPYYKQLLTAQQKHQLVQQTGNTE